MGKWSDISHIINPELVIRGLLKKCYQLMYMNY